MQAKTPTDDFPKTREFATSGRAAAGCRDRIAPQVRDPRWRRAAGAFLATALIAAGMAGSHAGEGSSAGARNPATIDPTITQHAYLKASNAGADDWFGYSLDVDVDTVVVGARLEDSDATGVDGDGTDNSAVQAGAAYVFTRDGSGTWSQQAYLKASNTETGDNFGFSVAVDGDTLVVGAPLEDSSATGIDGNEGDNSMSYAGAAYVFTRDGAGAWSQQAYLKASNTNNSDRFGISVSIDGDTIVVGARDESSSATGVDGDQSDNSAGSAGAAYVFTRDGTGVWSQQAYLKASNTQSNDWFGWPVAVEADTVVVGAQLEDSSATGVDGDGTDGSAGGAGAAYVFTRDGSGTWSQQAYLKASNTDGADSFGKSIAIDADTAVVGAWSEDSSATGVNGDETDNSASQSGAAYVFTRDGTGAWSQQAYLKASNTDSSDRFGESVAVDGDTVVVGARGEASSATGVEGDETDNSAATSGAAYVFARDGTGTWSQQAYLKASNTGGGDEFGHSVAVDGNALVVGAVAEDSSATEVDGDQGDNSASNAGAAYVYVDNQSPVAAADNVATDEDTALSGDVLDDNGNGADTDPDGDTLTVTRVNGSSGDVGTQITLTSGALLTLNSNGLFSYDPNGQFESLVAGDTASDSFTYAISDGSATDSATVSVTINGMNDAPAAADDADSTDEDNAVGAAAPGVLINDADVDTGDTLSVDRVAGSTGNVGAAVAGSGGGVFTVNTDGSYIFGPNGDFEGLGNGDSATTGVDYRAADGNGGTNTATLTVTVNGINDAPNADPQSISTPEDTSVDINLSGFDPEGEALAFSVTSGPTNGVLSGTAPNLTYEPDTTFTGPDSLEFEVCDPEPLCDTATVNITVQPALIFEDSFED